MKVSIYQVRQFRYHAVRNTVLIVFFTLLPYLSNYSNLMKKMSYPGHARTTGMPYLTFSTCLHRRHLLFRLRSIFRLFRRGLTHTPEY